MLYNKSSRTACAWKNRAKGQRYGGPKRRDRRRSSPAGPRAQRPRGSGGRRPFPSSSMTTTTPFSRDARCKRSPGVDEGKDDGQDRVMDEGRGDEPGGRFSISASPIDNGGGKAESSFAGAVWFACWVVTDTRSTRTHSHTHAHTVDAQTHPHVTWRSNRRAERARARAGAVICQALLGCGDGECQTAARDHTMGGNCRRGQIRLQGKASADG